MSSQIKNVVVLMLENRSFDHMLGWMKSAAYPINGLTDSDGNYPDPVKKTGTFAPVGHDAPYSPDINPSPGHSFESVRRQIFGADPVPEPPIDPNGGFLADYALVPGVTEPTNVMRCFAPTALSVIQTLAREFGVCDAWFSPMPGPTMPNRFFAHCATSGGFIDNSPRIAPMRTIYQNLEAAGVDWRIYFHDYPLSLACTNQLAYFTTKYERFDAFLRDAREKTLPAYSFIEPRYMSFGSPANDEHPSHGVAAGEALIAAVYNALRSSPQWNDLLFVVTWDEHGGFFDHEPPKAATPPDKSTSAFDFASYGIRVPAVLVSPWIAKGKIVSHTLDHTALLSTAKNLFELPSFLTARDASMPSLTDYLGSTLRTDAPETIPGPTDAEVAENSPSEDAPLNDLQEDIVILSRLLDPEGAAPKSDAFAFGISPAMPKTEAEAAQEVQKHLQSFASRA